MDNPENHKPVPLFLTLMLISPTLFLRMALA